MIRALPLVLLLASSALAIDVEGVLPASLDQPRIYLALSVDAKSPPLVAKGGSVADAIADAIGEKRKKGDAADDAGVFAVEAFLDTGASGIVLSNPTAVGLGLTQAKTKAGAPIVFHDVGVAGGERFSVAGNYFARLADYGGNSDGDQLERYAAPLGPVSVMFRESAGLLDEFTGGVDVAGMPLMQGKVMVCDARGLAKYDKIRTSLVAPADESIPACDVLVPLAYVDFTRFTRTEPCDAPRVTTAANPMIGPNPFDKNDRAKPVTMTHNGKSASLTMLLDTGAASSMISTAKARALGMVVDASGKLTNVPEKDQFTLPIGGIGGAKNVNGFYVDAVALPASKGEPIRYVKAPVLVLDIDVEDPSTHEKYTLDGVLGMNYLVASASVSVGLTGGIDDVHDGAFDFFVIDHVRRTLGVKVRK